MGGDDRRIGIAASYERRTAKDAEGERKRREWRGDAWTLLRLICRGVRLLDVTSALLLQ